MALWKLMEQRPAETCQHDFCCLYTQISLLSNAVSLQFKAMPHHVGFLCEGFSFRHTAHTNKPEKSGQQCCAESNVLSSCTLHEGLSKQQ